MNIISGINNFKKNKDKKPLVVALGNFDGMHIAHRKIIKTAIRIAKKIDGLSLVLTFYPHPVSILHPKAKISLLTSLEQKIGLIKKLRPDFITIIEFKKEFSNLTAELFASKYLSKILGASFVVVGEKFNFGKNKTGDVNELRKLGKLFGFGVKIIPVLFSKNKPISSSRIRKLIASGNLIEAEKILGRKYEITGKVIPGRKKGLSLKFPTANIDLSQKAIPPEGVYAVKIKVGGKNRKGMLNIGKRPTFYKNGERVAEVHIFNFKKNIYGSVVKINFIKKIREERKFKNPDSLTKQLHKDKKKVLSLL